MDIEPRSIGSRSPELGPKVVLGPLGLVALGAGLEIMRRDFVVGLVCSVPGALIFAFLAFCFALHVRA